MFTSKLLTIAEVGFHPQECILVTLFLTIVYRIYMILLVLQMDNHTLTLKGLFFLRLHIWLLLALWLSSEIKFFFLLSNGVLVKIRPDLLRQMQMKRKGCGRWMWVQAAGTALGRCCLALRCQMWRGFRVAEVRRVAQDCWLTCFCVFYFCSVLFFFSWFLLFLWVINAKILPSLPETAECSIQESVDVQEEEEYSWVMG